MDQVLIVGKWLVENYVGILGGISGILAGAYVIACIFPGDHPDIEIQKVADFLKKFSRKPAPEEKKE